MPSYRLRKAPKRDLYWVIGPDGKHHSKEPIPKERAEAQRRALYAAERKEIKGGQETVNPFDPAFAEQEVAKSRAAIQTGLAQLTPEQVDANLGFIKTELAPTKFTTRDAPTLAEYERYANAYKKRNQVPPMTYEQWLAFQSQRELGRQKDYTGMAESKRATLQDLGNVVAEREYQAALAAAEEARDPTVICPYNENGDRQTTRGVRTSECKRRESEWLRKNDPASYYFFRPVVQGLTDVADFAAENLAPILPGVGQVAMEVYKNFAPPTSKFADQNLIKQFSGGQMHYVRVRGGGSTKRQDVLKKYGLANKSYSLEELSEATKVPLSILKEVYKRGLGAYNTQPKSVRLKGSFVKNVDAPMSAKLSAPQWAQARVYSFLAGNPAHDNDLRANKGGKIYCGKKAAPAGTTKGTLGQCFKKGVGVGMMLEKTKVPDLNTLSIRDLGKYAQLVKLKNYGVMTRAQLLEELLPRRAAIEAALRAKVRGSGLVGGAWWIDAFNKAKELAKAAVQKTKDVAQGVVQRVKDVAQGVRKDNYPPRVRKMIAQIGDRPIVDLKVRRDPIKGMLHTALNLITLGKWDVMRSKLPFDKIFHLGLEFTIRVSDTNDMISRYILEKNEVINVEPAKAVGKDTELWNVGMHGSTTLNKLLEGAQQVLGPIFFTYDAFNNNCADFIQAVLKGSGLATPALTAIVKQPLDNALRTELPTYTEKVARAVTDVAALANVAIEGRGAGGRFQAQLRSEGVKPKTYLQWVRRAAQRFEYPARRLTWSDKPGKKLMIETPDGRKVHFGAVGHGDYWIYRLKGQRDLADRKRRAYLARARRIKGDWAKDKYSPNSLAIDILWFPKEM